MVLLIQNHVKEVINNMKNLTKEELKKIRGGSTSLTSSMLNYLGDLIDILISAGRKLGSSIRRIGSNKICPLD